MIPEFPVEFPSIEARIQAIDPIRYAKTRNYEDGAVTYLSPYLSRGVISTRNIVEILFSKGYSFDELESLLMELAWRDYFQRVQQHRDLLQEIQFDQQSVAHRKLPLALLKANTGIWAIDSAIEKLYETGYMHNHLRMYLAAVACNVGQSHWLLPAKWMYFHLLDGDWASNACSWQWVAGSNSKKKYFANQENINRYTRSTQAGSFLDIGYEEITQLPIPEALVQTSNFEPNSKLPQISNPNINPEWPTLIYTYYNLDPKWLIETQANRILLLEPSHFNVYPVSERCLDFAFSLAGQIDGIQVFCGEFQELKRLVQGSEIHYKEHPFSKHFQGTEHARNWMTPDVTGYYDSFFKFWKHVKKSLLKQHKQLVSA